MPNLRFKERGVNVCLGLLILASIIWALTTLSYSRTSRNSNSKITENNYIPKPMDPKRIQHRKKLSAILRDCGQLCDTTRKGTPGPYFDHITAPIDCTALFKNEYIDLGHGEPVAPKEIPEDLMDAYTMGNRIRLLHWYFNEPFLGGSNKPHWTVPQVNKLIELAKKGILPGTYGRNDTNSLRDGLKNAPEVKNGRVLVIGSRNPWVEACVLEAGAREVVTLEYGEIISDHPKLKTLVPEQFRKQYLENNLGTFDAVVTFSSVEHSGLGRFGDMLNPWGDIITIARAWCVTKEKGSLIIGVPYDYHNEYIRFNGDRGYGKIRYPYLTTNWKQYYKGWGVQCVHVFTKIKYP